MTDDQQGARVPPADQETAELRAEAERLRRELAEETEAHRADLLADIEEGLDASNALIEALSRAEAAEAEVERLQRSLENHERWRSLWEERAEAESARLASEQRELAAEVAALRSLVAKVPDVCPLSKRADGKHSFRFDGDDPYIVCHFCDEMRDSLTGRVIRPAASSADDKAGE